VQLEFALQRCGCHRSEYAAPTTPDHSLDSGTKQLRFKEAGKSRTRALTWNVIAMVVGRAAAVVIGLHHPSSHSASARSRFSSYDSAGSRLLS
jgi:hypothetical protein